MQPSDVQAIIFFFSGRNQYVRKGLLYIENKNSEKVCTIIIAILEVFLCYWCCWLVPNVLDSINDLLGGIRHPKG